MLRPLAYSAGGWSGEALSRPAGRDGLAYIALILGGLNRGCFTGGVLHLGGTPASAPVSPHCRDSLSGAHLWMPVFRDAFGPEAFPRYTLLEDESVAKTRGNARVSPVEYHVGCLSQLQLWGSAVTSLGVLDSVISAVASTKALRTTPIRSHPIAPIRAILRCDTPEQRDAESERRVCRFRPVSSSAAFRVRVRDLRRGGMRGFVSVTATI